MAICGARCDKIRKRASKTVCATDVRRKPRYGKGLRRTALDPHLWHGERRIDKKKRIPACAMFRSRNPKNSLQNGPGRKQRNGPLQVSRSKAFRAPSIPRNFQPNPPCPNPMQRPGSLFLRMSPKMAFHRRFLRTHSAGNKEPLRKDRLSCANNCQYCENHMEKIFPAVQRRERTSERAKSWRRQRIVARGAYNRTGKTGMPFCERERARKRRMAYLMSQTKISRSKANFAPTWRRRRDSNPRTAFDRYAISSRAPSTKLGDSSTVL